MTRVKIHMDETAVRPICPETPCLTVSLMDGTRLETARKIRLEGVWVLRQYRNPVPCGASVVLYPVDARGTYQVESRE